MYKFTEPKTAKVYFVLPNPWTSPVTGATICGLTAWNCVAFGWTREEYTPTQEARKFSKLKLLRNLEDLGMWETVRTGIENAGMMDKWNAAQYMKEDDTEFMAALETIAQQIPGFDLAGLLDNSIYDED